MSATSAANEAIDEAMPQGFFAATPPPVKARLANVMDLQLILPDMAAPPPEASSHAGYRIASEERTPAAASSKIASTGTPPKLAEPPSFARPMIRGLIADVIDEELRAPELKPAEVTGGVELTPPFAAWRHRRPKAAPIDEDIFGRRMGIPPPAYEEAGPPAYSEAEPTRPATKEQTDAETRAKAALEAQTKALMEARLQTLEISQQAQTQRESALQLAQEMQQHVGDAQRRLAEAAEQQAASLQRGNAELQQQLVELVRQEMRRDGATGSEHATAAEAASAARPPATAAQASSAPAQSEPNVGVSDMYHMLDGLRRLESRFEQQWAQAMHSQNAERSAHMEALRSLQRPPTTVQALVPLLPPAPPTAPPVERVATADTAAQVSFEDEPPPVVVDGEAQVSLGPTQEHEAKVARFTEYLLHGPPGHREPARGGLVPPLTAWPLPNDLDEIDAMLEDALGGPAAPLPPPSDSPDSSSMAQSSSMLEDLSLGEIAPGSRVDGRLERASPGEASPSELSRGELLSDVQSPGEVPRGHGLRLAAALRSDDRRAPSEPGEAAGRSAGEISGLSEEPSSGEITNVHGPSLVAGPVIVVGAGREWASENLEPGEVVAGASAALSEGEAADEGPRRRERRASPSVSSGEAPASDSRSTGYLSPTGGLEPYLSPHH